MSVYYFGDYYVNYSNKDHAYGGMGYQLEVDGKRYIVTYDGVKRPYLDEGYTFLTPFNWFGNGLRTEDPEIVAKVKAFVEWCDTIVLERTEAVFKRKYRGQYDRVKY